MHTVDRGYEVVRDKGCNDYIHMDWEMNGIVGGMYTLEECAAAVRELDGHKGCNGRYFFFEVAGYCNCPKDDCNGPPNAKAGGRGRLYEFTDGVCVARGGAAFELSHKHRSHQHISAVAYS